MKKFLRIFFHKPHDPIKLEEKEFIEGCYNTQGGKQCYKNGDLVTCYKKRSFLSFIRDSVCVLDQEAIFKPLSGKEKEEYPLRPERIDPDTRKIFEAHESLYPKKVDAHISRTKDGVLTISEMPNDVMSIKILSDGGDDKVIDTHIPEELLQILESHAEESKNYRSALLWDGESLSLIHGNIAASLSTAEEVRNAYNILCRHKTRVKKNKRGKSKNANR